VGETFANPRDGQRHYLAMAAELLITSTEPLYPYALAHLTGPAIAERLGLHRTAMYRLWPTQRAMWDDLVRVILTTPPSLERVTGLDLVGSIGDALLADPAVALQTALLAYRTPDPLQARMQWRTDSTIDAIARQIDTELRNRSLAPQEPLQIRDLATAIYCLADADAHTARLTSPTGSPGANSTTATLEAILRRCTRPRTKQDRAVRSASRTGHLERIRWTTRQRLVLDTATEMFAETLTDPASVLLDAPLGHLAVARVARKARVTRQAVQFRWSNQQELSLDLLRFLHREHNRVLLGVARRALGRWRPNRSTWRTFDIDAAVGGMREATPHPFAHLAFVTHYANASIRDVAFGETTRTVGAFADDLEHFVAAGYLPEPAVDLADLATIVLSTLSSASRLGGLQANLPAAPGDSGLAICVDAVLRDAFQPRQSGAVAVSG
jgi:AcrR family transcriptional regulator